MSSIEHHSGKLIPVAIFHDIEEREEIAKEIVKEEGYDSKFDKFEAYWDSYTECLEDQGYRTYYIGNGAIYKIEAETLDPEADIFKANKNRAEGTIEFEIRFYNGGCSFNEALDKALDRSLNM